MSTRIVITAPRGRFRKTASRWFIIQAILVHAFLVPTSCTFQRMHADFSTRILIGLEQPQIFKRAHDALLALFCVYRREVRMRGSVQTWSRDEL